MKIKCNAAGDTLLSDRRWHDTWWILFEIALCVAGTIVMLIIDIYDRAPSKEIQSGFCGRMYMAYDEIPLYLRSTRRYNHGRKSV